MVRVLVGAPGIAVAGGPSASVVICTHDRAHLVRRAAEAACAEVRACGGEVIVVDNASSDDTPSVLAALADREAPHLRVVPEPRLGLSRARNRGLLEAEQPIAAFLDDDAVPRPGWLAAHLEPYRDERVACVGGPIVTRFSAPPPPWLTVEFHPALSAYDLGPEPHRLQACESWRYPYGGNVSFRVAVARSLGGFSLRFGLVGGRQLAHEETDLCMRLDRAGWEIRYAPGAVVDHWIEAGDLTPRFFLERYRQRGYSAALCELSNAGLRHALYRLRWHLMHDFLGGLGPRQRTNGARLMAACRRREALGYLLGLARGCFAARPRWEPSEARV